MLRRFLYLFVRLLQMLHQNRHHHIDQNKLESLVWRQLGLGTKFPGPT